MRVRIIVRKNSRTASRPASGRLSGSTIDSPWFRNGAGWAPADLVDAVAAYVSDETRRPLTDFVTVQSAAIVEYAVVATITTFSGPDGSVVMDTARAKLDEYVASSHRIGRDVTRSGIFAALHVEGVQNVVLTSPAADIIITREQAPHCTGITLSYAGTGE